MSDDANKPFLSRWSQRKLAASRAAAVRSVPPAATVPAAATPAETTSAPSPSVPTIEATAPELPPVESLSFDSDFKPFLSPQVDESVRRNALRKLFADPRFNVMDGLDVYIDDYSKSEPIPPEVLAQLNHAKFLFDPPKTRINAQGYVEDVPPEPIEAAPAASDVETHVATEQTTTNHEDAKHLSEHASPSIDAVPNETQVVPAPSREGKS